METKLFDKLIDCISEIQFNVSEPNQSEQIEKEFEIDDKQFAITITCQVNGYYDRDETGIGFNETYSCVDELIVVDEDDTEYQFDAFQRLKLDKVIKNNLFH